MITKHITGISVQAYSEGRDPMISVRKMRILSENAGFHGLHGNIESSKRFEEIQ